MSPVKITKTLTLRILRPFYGKELEAEITKAKKEKVQKSKNKDVSAGQLDNEFWEGFKKRHPEIVDWNELRDVLIQLQKSITPIYNKSSAILYQKILEEGQVKAKKGNEQAAIKFAISRYIYPEVMNTIHNSYIALGLEEKLRTSFSGQKLKKIKAGLISSPSATSDTFPIPLWIQKQGEKGGFNIYQHGDDLILDIPFPIYRDKKELNRYKPWEKFEFVDTRNKKHINVLLSTLKRRRSGSWLKDWGTEAEIKKVMAGDYVVSKVEISKGKRIGDKNYWFVRFVVDFEKPVLDLDPSLTGAVDLGVSNPVVCAIYGKLNRLTIRDNDVIDFTKAELARLRSQRVGDRFRRGGRGIKHKFMLSESIQKKYDERRKKKMEEWASRIMKFFSNNGVGLVYIEDLDAKSLKEGGDYFSIQLRINWPVKEMQKLFERKFKENGIQTKYRNPAFSSQICNKCGKWNNYFDFEYRKSKNFPSFECKYCGYGKQEPDIKNGEIIWADYNAAKNLANPNFETVVKKAIPKDIREKYIKNEAPE